MLNKIFKHIQKKKTAENISPIPEEPIEKSWHEDFIVNLAEILKPKVYVELGLYECVVFNRVVPFAGKLFGVDINPKAKKFMLKDKKTKFFKCSTLKFAEYIKKQKISIDLLFIDADHSAEAVLKDFEAFFPFVSQNGIILLHDTHPENEDLINPNFCGDCYKTAFALSKITDEWEMMTIPVSPGLTLCRKRTKQLNWQS